MKAFRERKNLQFSNHVRSVEFNNITSSIKYCFVKGIVIPQTKVNENPYNVWVCIHENGTVLTGECGCVAGLISSCKHVFALLHYVENEVKLGHNKTCTSKNQKWDVRVYKKSEKVHPPTEISNVSFARPHPEYEYCLSSKRKRKLFEPRSSHDLEVKFTQDDWEELAEATNGTASILNFIKTTYSANTHLSSPQVPTKPPTLWEIVSNVTEKHAFYEKLLSSRKKEMVDEIQRLRSHQSDSNYGFRIMKVSSLLQLFMKFYQNFKVKSHYRAAMLL